MQNNRRNIGIALIILGLIILGLVIYFTIFKKSVTPNGIETPVENTSGTLPETGKKGTTTPSDVPRDKNYDISKEAVHQVNSGDLAKRAMLYSERLGSFSSQSEYTNFSDLKIYMTESMKAWADKTIKDLQEKNKGGQAYYGIETKALTTEVKSYDEKIGQAEIIVTTQRRESTEKIGGGEPFIQKINLSFLKVNGEWLMDKAYWQNK